MGDPDLKSDIRDWSQGHEKIAKGITLTGEEIMKPRDFCMAYCA